MGNVLYGDFVFYTGTSTPIVGIKVSIFNSGTQILSSLYNSSGVPITNPVTTDSTGYFSFYILPGSYDIYIRGVKQYTIVLQNGEPAGTAQAIMAAHLIEYDHTKITHSNRASLDLVSGTNTGDQTPQTLYTTHILPDASTGMNATITTISTRSDKTVDGWYKITDEADVIDLWISPSWLAPLVSNDNVTLPAYVIGSNLEDILYTGNDNYLILPDAGLTKPIKIICSGSGFLLKTKAMLETTVIKYVPENSNPSIWYIADKNNDIILSNTIGDVIELSPKYSAGGQLRHGIMATTMISYLGVGNSGGWGNEPVLNGDGSVYRFSTTS